jgi:tRNA modification GTPase
MLSDPICALATPPGRSALAVVRLSGRGAFDLARRVLGLGPGAGLPAPRQATLHTFHDRDGQPLDQGLVTCFPGPGSYTGEDLVEFSCHGGLLVPAQLLAALHAAGARPAEPGEFTRRALQHGRLDLVQAEAVADLVDATAPAQGRAALRQLGGLLSRRIAGLREELLDALALLSYDIDFPDEDDGPLDRARVREALDRLARSVQGLLATAPLGERLRAGALVVLAGRPNAGKSSLFNALLGQERALVTEVPGTTRDAIEATADVDGWPLRLADTAGLHDTDDRLERLGIEVSRRWLAAADLVLLCVEAGRGPEPGEREMLDTHPCLLVRTKADLAPQPGPGGGLAVSALTGRGLGELRQALSERLFGGLRGGDMEPLLTRERHRTALQRGSAALAEAMAELETGGGDAVLVAHHLRQAVTALDELVGLVDVEEVLGRVFARFCVGK